MYISCKDQGCDLLLVLSGINNLKSVRFFKLVLRYDYSIVIYMFPACWHLQCSNYVYVYMCVCVLPLLCLNVIRR